MADSGQSTIRGIDIDKLAKGFADEEFVFKRVCTLTNTTAREIRWYQKTAGTLGSVSTSGITASQIANTSQKSRPVVVEQSWTRNTSYVRKYFVESPVLSTEDIQDTDIDILATNIRDLVRSVAKQVDARIYSVASSGTSNSTASTAAWDAGSGQDPIKDIMVAKRKIRQNGYDPEGAYLLLSAKDHESLLVWLISTKGASIPTFSSARLGDGVVMEILGCRVLVSENVTADEAMVVIPQRAITWKSFVALTTATIEDKGIGTKIRVWEEGEAILTDSYACAKITNTQA
jgi:hypothetical protein